LNNPVSCYWTVPMDSLGNVEAREYVFYYAQLKWHNHVRAACEAGLQRKGSDTQLQFWHQFAACMLGNYNEAINELERMRGLNRSIIRASVKTSSVQPTLGLYAYHNSQASISTPIVPKHAAFLSSVAFYAYQRRCATDAS
jgi:hypothetical protein